MPLTKGDLVRVDAWYRKRWRQLMTMRVDGCPSPTPARARCAIAMADDLALLTRQKRDWSFRKTKQRGRGWYPGEIAKAVAKKEGLRIGNIHRGKHRIAKLEKKDTHGLDVIFAAYKKERAKTGKRYLVRIRDNKLEIEPYHHSTYTYVLDEAIEAASVTRTPEKAEPGDGVARQGPDRQGVQGPSRSSTATSARRSCASSAWSRRRRSTAGCPRWPTCKQAGQGRLRRGGQGPQVGVDDASPGCRSCAARWGRCARAWA